MHTSNSHCQLNKHLVDTVCKHGTGQPYCILSEVLSVDFVAVVPLYVHPQARLGS